MYVCLCVSVYYVHACSILLLPVCKYKTHKRCAYQVRQNCKWATTADLERDSIPVQDDVSIYVYILFSLQWGMIGPFYSVVKDTAPVDGGKPCGEQSLSCL